MAITNRLSYATQTLIIEQFYYEIKLFRIRCLVCSGNKKRKGRERRVSYALVHMNLFTILYIQTFHYETEVL